MLLLPPLSPHRKSAALDFVQVETIDNGGLITSLSTSSRFLFIFNFIYSNLKLRVRLKAMSVVLEHSDATRIKMQQG